MAKIEIMPLDIDPAIYLAKLKTYTDIPPALFQDKNLTLRAAVIYAFMYSTAFPVEMPFLYISIDMLKRHFQINPAFAVSVLNQLEKYGYIYREFATRGQDSRIYNLHKKQDELKNNRTVIYRISLLVNYDSLNPNTYLKSFRIRLKDIWEYGIKNAIIYRYIYQAIVDRKLKRLTKNIQVKFIAQDLNRSDPFVQTGLKTLEKQGLIVWTKFYRKTKCAIQLVKPIKNHITEPKKSKRTLMDSKERWWERQRKFKQRAEARKLARAKS